jgi:TorA maturation chaperone TorD
MALKNTMYPAVVVVTGAPGQSSAGFAAVGDRYSFVRELGTVLEAVSQGSFTPNVDEVDRARAQEYALLATLLSRSPDSVLLSSLADLRDDASPIGVAHGAVREAAVRVNEDEAAREYFVLFAGLREGSLLPYSSHYLAETLYGRPLARLRETLRSFGIEIAPELSEPEDHAAILCEIMAGLADGSIPAPAGAEREFFQEQLSPWIGRFFFDLEHAEAGDFYSAVGLLGRTFVDLEAEAFSRSA